MKDLIKDASLLSSPIVSLEDCLHIIEVKKHKIKDSNVPTYLSEVLTKLPNGLIHKDETGMGATTLELETLRNSIIVEPIKITASSKAHSHSLKTGNKVLYVGSETKYHPKPTSANDIKTYLSDPRIPIKKIIVVADSLPKVINAIGKDVFKDFFLLLDEIDSFQLDSSFRRSMEKCIDLYKKFDKDKRAMVSATLIDFSDKELQSETKTVITYETKTNRQIEIIKSQTKELLGNIIDTISSIHSLYPNEKILVAFNSVKGNVSLAENLKSSGVFKDGDIKILCSKNSKEKAGIYYHELDSDILPGKINFITSAYFTGFDINERYHLISVSANKINSHSLSDNRLKQIAGRCRNPNGLISETIIHDIANFKDDYEHPTLESILKTAETELKTLECINNHFKKIPALNNLRQNVSDQIVSVLEKGGVSFVRKNIQTQEPEISYLNIDAFLENANTKYNIYKEYPLLSDLLSKQGHVVKSIQKNSSTLVQLVNTEEVEKEKKTLTVIQILKNNLTHKLLIELVKSDKLNSFQKKIVSTYIDYYEYIDRDILLNELETRAKKNDSRALNNFKLSAHFCISAPGDLYKSRMNKYFPIGSKLTSAEILQRLNFVFVECHITKKIDKETSAVKFLKSHFKCTKDRLDKKFTIKNTNPLKLKIIKVKNEIEDTEAKEKEKLEFLLKQG